MAKTKPKPVEDEVDPLAGVDPGDENDAAEEEGADGAGGEGGDAAAEEALEADATEVIPEHCIRLEGGPLVAVEADEVRQRRLVYEGHNIEHVSDEKLPDGRTVWVYRQM